VALTSKSLRNAVFACHAQSREFNQIVARSATANTLRAGAAIRARLLAKDEARTHVHGTRVPVEERSTSSIAVMLDASCCVLVE